MLVIGTLDKSAVSPGSIMAADGPDMTRRKFTANLTAGGAATAATLAGAPSAFATQMTAPAIVQRSPSRTRLEMALARINDPGGEGARACLTVYTESARAAADA